MAEVISLVTGATRGIGREVARQLAARGHVLYIGCRALNVGRSVAADIESQTGSRSIAVALDVTDTRSIDQAIERIGEDVARLDVLVNNAAIFRGAPACEPSINDARAMFETNVLGVLATTWAALPLLKQSASGRVVNVSSSTGSIRATADGSELPGDATRRMAYAASKAALNMVTVHLAQAFDADPDLRHVKINAATPGYTATAMNDFAADRTVEEGARSIVALATLPADGPSGAFWSEDGPTPW